jgi:putative endonuclease
MSAARIYYAYILTNRSRTLYVGVTNDLRRRLWEHRYDAGSAFTSRYRIDRLVGFEAHGDVRAAIARETQIKGWTRAKKMALIVARNPAWHDLSEEWGKLAVMRFRGEPVNRMDSSGGQARPQNDNSDE